MTDRSTALENSLVIPHGAAMVRHSSDTPQ